MKPEVTLRPEAVAAALVVSVRKAKIDDARPLAALMSQLGYPTREAEMAGRLSASDGILGRSDYLVAVAVRRGEVVGVIVAFIGLYLEMNGRYGRVTALSVAEGHRGQGIGTRLLAHAESWLRARGATACIVNSSTHRTEAHRFYTREGYQVTGLRFYKDLRGLESAFRSANRNG
jgi:GNAT superfamily N-acetyltransferase